MLIRIFLQASVGKSVPSLRKEKETYKAMSNHNHTGSIWGNATDGVNRHSEPNKNSATIGIPLQAGQSLIVLCYSRGQSMTFKNPNGHVNTSDAWDFVVTSDQDPGGYVADVYVDTGDDIARQLGEQGRCDILQQSLATHHAPLG
jgi:hypothetical protein